MRRTSLRFIPGDYIGNAERTLPGAATVEHDSREVTVEVPDRFLSFLTLGNLVQSANVKLFTMGTLPA